MKKVYFNMVVLTSWHQSSLAFICIHQQNITRLHLRLVKNKFYFFFWNYHYLLLNRFYVYLRSAI